VGEIGQTPGVTQAELKEIEDQIAEYEAKRAWYEARLVELNSRRVSLYRELTGNPPAFVYSGTGQPLGASLEEVEKLSGDLARSAKRLHERMRKLAGGTPAPGVSRSEATGAGTDDGGELNTRSLLSLLAGSADDDDDETRGGDMKKLALQLLPKILADRGDD